MDWRQAPRNQTRILQRTDSLRKVKPWCLVAVIAALGMKTSFKNLFDAGFRPLALMVAKTLWIGALVTISVVAFM
jgi:uncharacterized membrane protein YadS